LKLIYFFVAVVSFSAIAEFYVYHASSDPQPPQNIDAIFLLGSNGDTASPVTVDRTATAIRAAERWPKAKIILTGNEARGEVTAFRTLMNQASVAPDRLIEETDSRNTWDNIKNSKRFVSASDAVLVVTSGYHLARALAIARSQKLNAYGWSGDQSVYKRRAFFWIKERLSNMRYLLEMVTQ
jgi:uncharacterized SAM-binding protein YcdF (DUF218 family)